MPLPRKRLVSLEATPYYHVVSRCVRRQFLCGPDALTGRDFSHRRGWILNRVRELAGVFAMDVCAYAIMSNHFHLVLRVDQDRALAWDAREVAERWLRLFTGPPFVRSFVAGDSLTDMQSAQVAATLEGYRQRLHDLSWFMRCLNEPIARQANAEDGCTGRFWEGRFKSQALLDEAALLTAMAYVDLNPVRAGMADTPEASDFTSIQEHIRAWTRQPRSQPGEDLGAAVRNLLGFADQTADPDTALPFNFPDYLELVDWSGRAIVQGKRGAIPDNLPPILQRLCIQPAGFVRFIRKQENGFHRVIGTIESLKSLAHRFGRRFFKGQTAAAWLFSPGG